MAYRCESLFFSQPVDEGFDFSSHFPEPSGQRGTNGMPNRLKGLPRKESDPYCLDENGYPRDHVTEEALGF